MYLQKKDKVGFTAAGEKQNWEAEFPQINILALGIIFSIVLKLHQKKSKNKCTGGSTFRSAT